MFLLRSALNNQSKYRVKPLVFLRNISSGLKYLHDVILSLTRWFVVLYLSILLISIGVRPIYVDLCHRFSESLRYILVSPQAFDSSHSFPPRWLYFIIFVLTKWQNVSKVVNFAIRSWASIVRSVELITEEVHVTIQGFETLCGLAFVHTVFSLVLKGRYTIVELSKTSVLS